jgi:membrane-associated phospholipid phosphatase
MVYILWQVHQGQLSDLDIQLRKQRARPLLLSIACSGLAWLIMALSAAPVELAILAGALWLQMVVVMGITLRWKISMHSTAAAGAATVIWSLVGTPLPLLIGVPLIAWSRVRLHRHTLSQTVAGAALGFGVVFAALWLAF